MARFIHSGGIVNHQNKMTEIVNPVIGTSTQEALAVAQTVFADTRINWSVVNSNAAEVTMDLVGISVSSGLG